MLVAAILMILIALLLAFLSLRQFTEKGALLNNCYLYASAEERRTMNKTPYYRQTGGVFALLAAVFLADAVYVFTQIRWMILVVFGLIGATVVFAILSSVRIARREKNKQ